MDVESVVDPLSTVAAAASTATQQHVHAHASIEAGASAMHLASSTQLAAAGAVVPLPPAARMTGTVKPACAQRIEVLDCN